MPSAIESLLNAILDSWDRNNLILVNLLGAIPPEHLQFKATEDSPTLAGLFHHIHYVRLVFVSEDVPELARPVPELEWVPETNTVLLTEMLNASARAVRDAVESRIASHRDLDVHYDDPILLLQHMIWHEGYHHGQIKLVLKLAGCPISDAVAGPLTWSIWMRKKKEAIPL